MCLGKETKEHVEQHPETGLGMVWVTGDALFKHIDTRNWDYVKLTKLSDILMELLSAENNGDWPGLTFLAQQEASAQSCRSSPFVCRKIGLQLVYLISDKSMCLILPFIFLWAGLWANIANDPSFNFLTQTDTVPRTEKLAWQPNEHQGVSVCKTYICQSYFWFYQVLIKIWWLW